jgi:hypothetical protein
MDSIVVVVVVVEMAAQTDNDNNDNEESLLTVLLQRHRCGVRGALNHFIFAYFSISTTIINTG